MSSIGSVSFRPSAFQRSLKKPAPRLRFAGDPPPPQMPAVPKKTSLRNVMNMFLASLLGGGIVTGAGIVQNQHIQDDFRVQVSRVDEQFKKLEQDQQSALSQLAENDKSIQGQIAGAIVPVAVISRTAKAGVRIEGSISLGSGTFFRDNNNNLYIITNDHVVRDNEMGGKLKVRLYNGTDVGSNEVEAEVVKLSNGNPVQSEGKDLAVLRVIQYPDRPAFNPPHALSVNDFRDLTKEPLKAGEAVFAVGTPQGLNDVISRGIVSHAHRNVPWNPQVVSVQTDAPINPGNSGGGLYDSQGRMIGVMNTSLIRKGADGLSFAISIESVKAYLNENSIPVPAPAAEASEA